MVRDFGERYSLARYTNPFVRCTEDEAWMFTAIGLHLSGAEGSYRGPFEASYMYMTFSGVTFGHRH